MQIKQEDMLPMELKDITAKNITALRLRTKMTQLELGNAISYSDKAISKWERGEAIPDAYVLLKLAEIFGVSVDYILKDHAGEPVPKVRRSRANHASITALTVIAIWTLFAIAFITVYLPTRISYWMFFDYAFIASLVMLTVFNSMWGKKSLNILIVSALVISLIFTLYFLLLPVGNFWQILLLSVPAELIVICCFKLKIKNFKEMVKMRRMK